MSTNIRNRVFKISAGPSKDALFDACKYAYSKIGSVSVEFTLSLDYKTSPGGSGCAYIPMKIAGIKILKIDHEDDSGENFNISGECEALQSFITGMDLAGYKFMARYNVKTRTGEISFQ